MDERDKVAETVPVYDTVYIWSDVGVSITGRWSANQHPEEALAYVPAARLAEVEAERDAAKETMDEHFARAEAAEAEVARLRTAHGAARNAALEEAAKAVDRHGYLSEIRIDTLDEAAARVRALKAPSEG